jgi:hypothetical protein
MSGRSGADRRSGGGDRGRARDGGRPRRPTGVDRAQSSALGTVLLALVGVVLVGGLLVTGSSVVDEADRDASSAALAVEANATAVTVVHESGDVLRVSELVLVVDGDDTERIPFAEFDRRGDGDDRVTAGEPFVATHGVGGSTLDVRVVRESGDESTTLARVTRAVEGATGIDFSADGAGAANAAINGGSTDGTTTVEDGGRTVVVEGNQWATASKTYTVTPDTRLSFTFESDNTCEIHAIGFASAQNERRMVYVAGSQGWGTNVTNYGGEWYRVGDGRVRYDVPIGEVYEDNGQLGADDRLDATELTFVNDCDDPANRHDASEPVESRFGDVRAYEGS